MTVLSHGIDLVEIARIARMLADHPERFAEKCFTAAERAYCDRSTRRRAEHYAARFAAKEAVLKALGTGWRDGIAWTDIEIVRAESGAPSLALTGEAARIAGSLGVARWSLSMSHAGGDGGYAVASAIAIADSAR